MRVDVYTRHDAFVGSIGGGELLAFTHTDELNGEDSVAISTTFRIREGYRLVWRDRDGQAREHVCQDPKGTHEGGAVVYTDTALNSICELYGDFIEDKRPYSYTFQKALEVALAPTRWAVGTVDQPGNVSKSLTFYHISAREALQSILDNGGEMSTAIEVAGAGVTARRINIRKRLGRTVPRRFEYGRDALSISKTEHRTAITACYGYGKGVETDTGGYGRKLTFGSINGGKDYVEDAAALKAYGRPDGNGRLAHVFGTFEDSECEDASVLLSETKSYLADNSTPGVTYEADASDLAAMDAAWAGAGVGDAVHIVDREFSPALRAEGRVTKVVTDYLAGTVSVTVGNVAETIADMWSQQRSDVQQAVQKSEAAQGVAGDVDQRLTEARNELEQVRKEASAAQKAADAAQGRADAVGVLADDAKKAADAAQTRANEVSSRADKLSQNLGDVQKTVTDQGTRLEAAAKDATSALTASSELRQSLTSLSGKVESHYKEQQATQDTVTKVQVDLKGVSSQVAQTTKTAEDALTKASQLQQSVEGFKTEVSTRYATKEQLEGLDVGGTNLLRDTKAFWRNGVDSADTGYLRAASGEGDAYNGFTVRKVAASQKGATIGEWLVNGCKPGEEYTLSFWAKGTSGKAIKCFFYDPTGYTYVASAKASTGASSTSGDGNIDVALTNSWARYWVTFKLRETAGSTDQKYALIRNDNAIDCWVCGAKLERGNKATDWSPSPLDADALYATKSSLNQTAESIRGEIASKYTTKDESKTLASKTELAATKDSILGSVASNYVDKKTGETLATKAEVSTKANEITQAVSKTYSTKAETQAVKDSAQMRVWHKTSGTGGTPGWFHVAQLKVLSNYANAAIRLTVTNRISKQTDIEVQFASVNNVDPGLSSLRRNGPAAVAMVKSAASTWELYVQKSEGYDSLTVTNLLMPSYNPPSLAWKTDQVSSLPSGAIQATEQIGSQDAATYVTQSKHTQTAEQIRSEVAAKYQLQSAMGSYAEKSYVDQKANAINQSVEAVKTTANKAASDLTSLSKMASKTYTFYVAQNESKYWVRLGTLVSGGDATNFYMEVLTGDGYNGTANQNSRLQIVIKDGWQATPSASTAFGVSVLRENCQTAQVKVMASAHNTCEVWVYLPWQYPNGQYTISGSYTSWTPSVTNQAGAPTSGTSQSVEYRLNAEQLKEDVADTYTTKTELSQTASGFTQSVKEVSQKLGETVSRTSALEQDSASFKVRFNNQQTAIDGATSVTKQISNYFTFAGSGLTIGRDGADMTQTLTNDSTTFRAGGQDVVKLNGLTSTLEAQRVKLGRYQWMPTNGGANISLMYVG